MSSKTKVKILSLWTIFFAVFVFSLCFGLVLPFLAQAQTAPASSTTVTAKPLVPCGSASSPCTLCHLITGVANLVTFGLSLLVAATLAAIAAAGVMYAVSSGSQKMMTTAKSFLSSALVGFAIVLAAWLIVYVTMTYIVSAKPGLGIGQSAWSGTSVSFSCNSSSNALTGSSTGATNTTTNPNPTADQIAQQQAACNNWCDQAGGNADYTSSCKAGCTSDAAAATQQAQAANNGISPAQQQQNQQDCDTYCNPGGTGTTTTDQCKTNCMAAKTQEAQQATNSAGTGNGSGIVSSAQSMKGNCGYCNVPENNPAGCSLNGCSGNPPYADCSNFVSTMYKNNGYSSPGSTTAQMYPKGQDITNSTTYSAGDLIVTQTSAGGASNHVVMCENDGCSTVIHDSGVKDTIKESSGSYYQAQPGARIIKASDYKNS